MNVLFWFYEIHLHKYVYYSRKRYVNTEIIGEFDEEKTPEKFDVEWFQIRIQVWESKSTYVSERGCIFTQNAVSKRNVITNWQD